MSRASIERKLRGLSRKTSQLGEEIQMLDQQVAHFAEAADDARLRSLVSESGEAARDYRQAEKTLVALSKDRESLAARLGKLELRQDALLDKLLEA